MEGTQHPISDEGRRMADAYAEALRRGGQGRWIACALATGASDGEIYDTKEDAIRHTDDTRYAYAVLNPIPMTAAEATHWIDLHRRLNKAGMRLTDPGAPQPIPDLGPAPRLRRRGFVLPGRRGRAGRPELHIDPRWN